VVNPPSALPAARLLFTLDPGVAHLNHGSFGAVPIPVQRAQQRLRDEVEANSMRFFTQGLADRLGHTRRHVAAFLGADPDRVALVDNATAGVALVLYSLGLRSGDEIVVTDHGYNAVTVAVERERRRNGVSVRTVRLPLTASAEEITATILSSVTPGRTRLLILDQIASPTARVMPVARVAAGLRGHGVTLLVDAAHAPGMLPDPVGEIGADFWVGNLHKWAFAPRPSAALVVAPEWRDRIEPPVISYEYPAGFPTSLEFLGTRDYTAWLAAPVGLYTLRTLGLSEVRAHNAALAAYGQQVLGAALGLDPGSLPDPGGRTSMRLVPLPPGVATTMPEATALRLRISTELSAEVAISSWNGTGLLRLSAQVYNRAEEYDRLADRLPALLAAFR
jgi:isopenicillin-N epimerase